jgi:hypothetical protein
MLVQALAPRFAIADFRSPALAFLVTLVALRLHHLRAAALGLELGGARGLGPFAAGSVDHVGNRARELEIR